MDYTLIVKIISTCMQATVCTYKPFCCNATQVICGMIMFTLATFSCALCRNEIMYA